MIAVKPFSATIPTSSGGGKFHDQPCDVVGVRFDGEDYQLVVVVRVDGGAYAKAVEIVDLPIPSGHAFM
jgi:hypothetical protein